jgi:hypothetical protein
MIKVLLVLFFVFPIYTFSYEYLKNIEVSGKNSYKEFYLTKDIYLKSKNNLNDLRIKNEIGDEVPYVIEKNIEISNRIEKKVSIGKIISKKNKETQMETVVKFTPKTKLDDIVGNIIQLKAIDNFYSKYELLGSDNGKNWIYISSGELYKTPEKEELRIEFIKKKYSYYKIVTALTEKIKYNALVLLLNEKKIDKKTNIITNLQYKVEEKRNNTIVTIESNNLPLQQISLKINDEFKRNYIVRNDKVYKTGNLFKVGNREKLDIQFNKKISLEQIILEIENGDNKPLMIEKIQGEYLSLKIIFKAKPEEKYILTFGDRELFKPRYDLEEFSEIIKVRDLVVLGDLKSIPKMIVPVKKDWTVYYNIFIVVIVILLSGFIVTKIVKKNN